MTVPSLAALAFTIVVALLLLPVRHGTARNIIFFVANCGFIYSFAPAPAALLPLIVFLLAGFAAIKLVDRVKLPLLLAGIVTGFVAALFILKRYPIVPGHILPTFDYFSVGLSYIFFRIVHLIIDTFQEVMPERIGFLTYLNYTLNFTTLISGPVQLFPDYHKTTKTAPAAIDAHALGYAFERIAVGFFKVAIPAPILLASHKSALAQLYATTALTAQASDITCLIIAYAGFLYLNFSGYTDFVIGLARLLRIELPENFRHPFMSSSFLDFWGHWHITLSHWLKTYVYTPLLLFLMRLFPTSAVAPYLGVVTFFVTFFLVGIWHGGTTTFLFYGFLQGLGISIDKLYAILATRVFTKKRYKQICADPLYIAVSRGLTFSWFSLSLLWFWADTPGLQRLFSTPGAGAWALALLMLWFVSSVALSLAKRIGDAWAGREKQPALRMPIAYSRVAAIMLAAVATLSYEVVYNAPAPTIVYKAF